MYAKVISSPKQEWALALFPKQIFSRISRLYNRDSSMSKGKNTSIYSKD